MRRLPMNMRPSARKMEAVAAYFDKPVLREVDESAFYADIAGVREKLGGPCRTARYPLFCGQSACRCVMQCHP